jgi:hypothetical protein
MKARASGSCRSELAALKEHGFEVVVSFEKANSRITIPEAQTRNFVLSLHIGHAELQDRGRPVLSRAGATHAALTSAQSNGSSSESAQPCSRLFTMAGTLARPNGSFRSAAAACAEPDRYRELHEFLFVAELTR